MWVFDYDCVVKGVNVIKINMFVHISENVTGCYRQLYLACMTANKLLYADKEKTVLARKNCTAISAGI